ncbi:hypothetical protein QYE93_19195, partial [Enterobacter cloacae subsp. cloacae]|uniref:hypothetical protein n=1 Tax=Enterobacter cloacae TaxID=550 RepID=UPI002874EF29
TGGDVPLRKAEYGVLSLPTMIGEDPYIYSILSSFRKYNQIARLRQRKRIIFNLLIFNRLFFVLSM